MNETKMNKHKSNISQYMISGEDCSDRAPLHVVDDRLFCVFFIFIYHNVRLTEPCVDDSMKDGIEGKPSSNRCS